MSSSSPPADDTLADDRTARARIRDAAIETYARFGVPATTARKVAAAAGVSPGLVIHHFGSMDGLRAECDEHVAAVIRMQKSKAVGAGFGLDVTAAWKEAGTIPIAGYLARVLADDSPAVVRLVDDLVADAEGYLAQAVESGLVRPSADDRSRAVVLLMWSLGALVLHDHMERLLGVDLTEPGFGTDAAVAAYAGPAYEILSEGFFTDAYATHLRNAIAGIAGPTEGT